MKSEPQTKQALGAVNKARGSVNKARGSVNKARGAVNSHWLIAHASYWIKLVFQPLLAVAFVVLLAWLFGYAQRQQSWFNDAATSTEVSAKKNTQYACSMLCVFVSAPGRCPVCGMELQEIESTGDPKDLYGLTIEPAARRLANIQTVSALPQSSSKTIEVMGRVEYDETSVSTVAAYVEGRIEELFVEYTGATIREGDELAVLYSPDLYSDQVGFLQAKASAQNAVGNARVDQSNQRMVISARKRLSEKGLSESQISELETTGNPSSRLKFFAPATGTVVEKLATEGDYVKTGMPLFKIADLSTVWLMLEMYPEDAANLQLGQAVSVAVQSQVGRTFEGRVSFIDPNVMAKTRTVPVRVAISNEAGLLKIGDLGKAIIRSNAAGDTPYVLIPRTAVLMNGSNSVAYVETETGRFEFRQVQVAETLGDQVSIAAGIQPGEQVVVSGTFMLDSTFNIQGKASLIDPKQAAAPLPQSLPSVNADLDIDELPQMQLPEMEMPQMELPQMELPQMADPETEPSAAASANNDLDAELPEMSLPADDLPQMEIPQMELPQPDLPQTELPTMEPPTMEEDA